MMAWSHVAPFAACTFEMSCSKSPSALIQNQYLAKGQNNDNGIRNCATSTRDSSELQQCNKCLPIRCEWADNLPTREALQSNW